MSEKLYRIARHYYRSLASKGIWIWWFGRCTAAMIRTMAFITCPPHISLSTLEDEASKYLLEALREIYRLEIYRENPRRYRSIVDVGATAGEYIVWAAYKGFRGEATSIDPHTRIKILGPGIRHTHIKRPGEEAIYRAVEKAEKPALVKIDCEGCEENLDWEELLEIETTHYIVEIHSKETIKTITRASEKTKRKTEIERHPEQPVYILTLKNI